MEFKNEFYKLKDEKDYFGIYLLKKRIAHEIKSNKTDELLTLYKKVENERKNLLRVWLFS